VSLIDTVENDLRVFSIFERVGRKEGREKGKRNKGSTTKGREKKKRQKGERKAEKEKQTKIACCLFFPFFNTT
jgi:hypothetical protein